VWIFHALFTHLLSEAHTPKYLEHALSPVSLRLHIHIQSQPGHIHVVDRKGGKTLAHDARFFRHAVKVMACFQPSTGHCVPPKRWVLGIQTSHFINFIHNHRDSWGINRQIWEYNEHTHIYIHSNKWIYIYTYNIIIIIIIIYNLYIYGNNNCYVDMGYKPLSQRQRWRSASQSWTASARVVDGAPQSIAWSVAEQKSGWILWFMVDISRTTVKAIY